MVVLAAVFGYLAARFRLDRPNRRLVRDLPVIENVELYRHIDDIDFLRQLEAEGLFTESVDETEVDDAT